MSYDQPVFSAATKKLIVGTVVNPSRHINVARLEQQVLSVGARQNKETVVTSSLRLVSGTGFHRRFLTGPAA